MRGLGGSLKVYFTVKILYALTLKVFREFDTENCNFVDIKSTKKQFL
jgi:hypothetical protein